MKRVAVAVISLLLVAAVLSMPSTSYAFNIFGNSCPTGTNPGSDSAVCQENNTVQSSKNPANPLTGPNGILITVANLVAIVAGIIAVIVIILSGWKYITSGGDASKAKSAKDTLVYAIIGLVVIALADVIIGFVLSKL